MYSAMMLSAIRVRVGPRVLLTNTKSHDSSFMVHQPVCHLICRVAAFMRSTLQGFFRQSCQTANRQALVTFAATFLECNLYFYDMGFLGFLLLLD